MFQGTANIDGDDPPVNVFAIAAIGGAYQPFIASYTAIIQNLGNVDVLVGSESPCYVLAPGQEFRLTLREPLWIGARPSEVGTISATIVQV